MKFEFNQGVHRDCIKWLWENVGPGNVKVDFSPLEPNIRRERTTDDNWFYERVQYEIPSTDPSQDSGSRHVPTIFIENEQKAMLFALRWVNYGSLGIR